MSVPGLLRIISSALCVVIVASFVMFVWDELSTASANQSLIAQAESGYVIARDAHGREINPHKTAVRENIDKVADSITSPAENAVRAPSGSDEWAMRAAAMAFGLLIFGFGLRMLANFIEFSSFRRGGPKAQPQSEFTPGYR